METLRTKQGYVMNLRLRARLVDVMRSEPGIRQEDVARQLGVTKRTVADYLTVTVRNEIASPAVEPSMDDVDRSMMQQACKGNVAAARLVYMRMAQKGHVGPLPTLDELEAELRNLKQLEGRHDGTCTNDVDAVAADEA